MANMKKTMPLSGPRSPNLSRVAAEAGVSVATASIILNTPEKDHRFSEACKRRVKKVAARMGYQRNIHASRFRLRKAQAIGLVMEILDNEHVLSQPYWSRLLSGMDNVARKRGYEIVIVGPREGQAAVEQGITQYHQHRLDGLIIPARITRVAKRSLAHFDGPVIVINRSERQRMHTVYEDDESGLRAAVDHLLSLGHRDIAWIGPKRWPGGSASWRRALYRTILKEHGLPIRLYDIDHDKKAVENAEQLADVVCAQACRILGKEPPGALMCFNDDFALGVYRATQRLGIRIPEHLSVVGYDDAGALYFTPALTTVRSSVLDVGKQAVRTMIDWIEGVTSPPDLPIPVPIKPKLIVRESTAAAG